MGGAGADLGHQDRGRNRERRRHTTRRAVLCRSRGRPVWELDSLQHCAESSMESVRETKSSLGGAGRGEACGCGNGGEWGAAAHGGPDRSREADVGRHQAWKERGED